jgi:hypothetical protein
MAVGHELAVQINLDSRHAAAGHDTRPVKRRMLFMHRYGKGSRVHAGCQLMAVHASRGKGVLAVHFFLDKSALALVTVGRSVPDGFAGRPSWMMVWNRSRSRLYRVQETERTAA